MDAKPVRVAALGAVLVLGATACGGGGQGDEGPSVEEGGTLTFASWQWLEPERGELTWNAATAYTEENPRVEMEPQEIARKDYENTIGTQIGGGSGPDLLVIPDTYFMELAEAGSLEPLDDVLDPADEERLADHNDHANVDGTQYAFTWELVPYAFFWNENLLDEAGVEPPTTPEELVDAAATVSEETDATGFAVRHQMNEEAPWWIDFSNWPYGFGGGWSDGENLTIDSPENVEALTAYKEVYESGGFAVGDDASTYRARFAAGEIAMGIDTSSAVYDMVGEGNEISSDDLGASALPFPDAQAGNVGMFVGINANSENKQLARDYLRWMYTENAQNGFNEALAPNSVGTELGSPAEFVDEHPWAQAFQDELQDSRPAVIEGFEVDTPRVRTIVLSEVERVLTEDAAPEQALSAAQKEAESQVGD